MPLAQEEASGGFSSHGGTAGQEDSSPQRDNGLIYSTSCCKQQLDTVTPMIPLSLLQVVGLMHLTSRNMRNTYKLAPLKKTEENITGSGSTAEQAIAALHSIGFHNDPSAQTC